MNLCQLTTLKSRLGLGAEDVVDDALLAEIIAAVSGRFESECNRRFARTEDATYQFRADIMNIFVDRFPIEAVVSFHVKANETDGWEAAVVDYLIGPTLSVIELSSPIGTSKQIGRVTFDGGYVLPGSTPSAGQTALPVEIEEACLRQCQFLFQNRQRLGFASVAGEGGSVSTIVKDLLPDVEAVVRKHERWEP